MQRGEIGKRLKKLRELRGVSKTDLARTLNVDRKVIYNYERGCSLDADLADDVLKHLGGIHVLGVELTPEEARAVTRYIGSLRKEKREKERQRQNEIFKKYREEKEEDC